jgi:ribulose kinase
LGAAITAAVATGCYDSYEAACKAMVSIGQECRPNENLAQVYQEKYQRYLGLLDVLKPVWSELAWNVSSNKENA